MGMFFEKEPILKIYLARSISGQTYKDVVAYYKKTSKQLERAGYEILHPMTGKGILRNERQFKSVGYDHPCSTNHAIFSRDKWMVYQSDVVYVNLCNTEIVSIGSVSEMAIANTLNKHVVVSMESENIHHHAFVLEMASVIWKSHNEAMDYLVKLIKGRL
jgi:hypothetical protein